MAVALAVGWPAELRSAEASESFPAFGPKYMTVHNVKGVVGPSVQIDDEGMIAAAWVEEDKDTRTILFARSKTPGGPLGTPVAVNQPGESPYYRQEAPALIVRGQDVFVTWSMTHPKMTPDKPFSGELRLSRSTDGGRSFGPSTLVNDDDQVIQHTFDALNIAPDGVLHFAWIDGREGKKEPGTFVARSTDQGRTVTKNFKVDDNTCIRLHAPRKLVDLVAEGHHVDGLRDVRVESRGDDPVALVGRHRRGHGHDGNVRRLRIRAQHADRGDAVDLRQLDVHEHHDGLHLLRRRDAVLAIFQLDDFVAAEFEHGANELAVALVVLDQQHDGFHALDVTPDRTDSKGTFRPPCCDVLTRETA